MKRPHARSGFLVGLFSVLLVLLLVAGVLMHRWINRASEVDRQEQRALLMAAMRSFQGDFSATMQEVVPSFWSAPRLETDTAMEAYVAELYSYWQSTARQPQLVDAVSLGTIMPDGATTFRRFRPEEGQFEEHEWPVWLESFRDLLKQRVQMGGALEVFRDLLKLRVQIEGAPSPFPGFPLLLVEDHPVIVLSLDASTPPRVLLDSGSPAGVDPRRGPERFPPERATIRPNQPGPSAQLIGWCFLELDADYILTQLLPALAVRHFGMTSLSSYRIAVVTGDGQRILYTSDPSLTTEDLASVDATMPLFIPRPRGGPGPPNPGGPGLMDHRPDRGPDRAGGPPFGLGGENPPNGPLAFNLRINTWHLVARHQSGSIEAVVSASRRRNLIIGFGILFLLGSSIVALLVAAERSRTLAKRQMEFVAGVSHELRTPLSVIQSAGFNLARGLVEDSSRVRQYGTAIQTEGRRLSDMIEQMLSYAGIQSGRKQYDLRPIQVLEVIECALSEYASAFREAGWEVEKEVEEDLPPVLGEASALESAVKNLLHNALKYAPTGKWLRVSARANRSRKKTEIEVTVEDHGPGIDPSDLPHLFEPFYRGQKIVASAVPGAGLGLSLVRRHIQAHRGRVTVNSSPGKGTAVTLHLPVHEA
jgi:signal transduction histidine kinase